jgi:dimethylaniline monooxygenase (N-oxide forming)
MTCRPEAFTGKKVVVLGLGNTGSDIADILVGHASSIYISHSHGAIVVSPLLFHPSRSALKYWQASP